MKTLNFLDNWFENQTKAMNHWVETTRQVQKSVLNNEFIGKGPELYQNWLKEQRSLLDEVRHHSHELTRNFRFGNTEQWYDARHEELKKDIDLLSEMNKDLTEQFTSLKVEDPQKLGELQEKQKNWLSAYKKWLNNWMERFSEKTNPYPVMSNHEKNELLETIEALKDRIASMEKDLEASSKKTTGKKPSTSKRSASKVNS